MDLLNKLKSMWVSLNLIYKSIIISGVFIFLVVSGRNAYIPFTFLMVVSLLGAYDGIKHRKKVQTIICIVLLLGIFNGSDTRIVFFLLLTAVFLFGIYNGIKCNKKVQTTICILLLMGAVNGVFTNVIIKKADKAEKELQKVEEKKVSSIEEKQSQENNAKEVNEVSKEEDSIEVKKEDLTESELKLLKSLEMPDNIKKILNEKCKFKDDIVDVQYVDLSENDGEKILTIHGHIKSNFTNEMMLKQGFIIAKDVIKSVKPSYSTDIDRYNFWFTGDVIDGNGKSNQMKILQFEYQTKIFEGADLDLITTKDFIDYAENVWTLPGNN